MHLHHLRPMLHMRPCETCRLEDTICAKEVPAAEAAWDLQLTRKRCVRGAQEGLSFWLLISWKQEKGANENAPNR